MAWERISMNGIEWLLIEWNGNGMGKGQHEWDRMASD